MSAGNILNGAEVLAAVLMWMVSSTPPAPPPAERKTTVVRFERCHDFDELSSASIEVAFGIHGTRLYRTVDRGQHWNQVYETSGKPGEPAPRLSLVRAVSPANVWILAGANVLHSTDGGETFTAVGIGPRVVVRSLRFVDESTGFLVGERSSQESFHGIVLKTRDGGRSWQELSTGVSLDHDWRLRDVWPLSAQEVWVVGDVLLHSLDGGATWRRVKKDESWKDTTIRFSSSDVGWIGRQPEQHYLLTTNGGKLWQPRKLASRYPPQPNPIAFIDAKQGWAAAQHLYRTRDGGKTWTVVRKGGTGDNEPYFYAIEYLPKERSLVATSTCGRVIIGP